MMVIDPVGQGLVGSLSRPGGNVTGLSFFSEAISAKRLELLTEIVPGLARVGVLRKPLSPVDPTLWKDTEVAAQRLGVALEALEMRGPEDFEAAFATAKQRNAQALLAFDDALTATYRSQIITLAASSGLPAMYALREYPDAGGLMSFSMDGKGAWRDNVFVERFWRTLKYEEVYLKAYESVAEARSSIGCYLEFYNTRRPHSALDRRTPDQAYYGSLPLCVAAKRAQRGSACKLTRAA